MMKKLTYFVATISILTFLSITAVGQQVFVANLTSAQEVPTNGSTGKGVCTVTLNAAETLAVVNLTYSGLSSNATGGNIHGPAPVGVNNINFIVLTGVTGTSNTVVNNGIIFFPADIQYLRSGLVYVNITTVNNPNGELRGQLKLANNLGDYDGDGRCDIGVFRPSNGTWYILNSLDNSVTTQQWGQTGDNEYTADFDGDGRDDITVERDVSGNQNWYILQSSNNTFRAVVWGLSGVNYDNALPADYDGDGKADIAVFRPSNGTFYVLRSSDGGLLARQWGVGSDQPVYGDFDKDGKVDFAVTRDVGGVLMWYILQSSDGSLMAVQWGLNSDQTVNGVHMDYDGDGKADIAVWRPTNGTFYVRQSSNGALMAVQFGQNGDGPAGVDTDGDGKADFVAIREVSGKLIFYVLQSSNGAVRVVQWGITGDRPV